MIDYNLIQVSFARAEQPVFTERKGSGIVNFGEKNTFPTYLNDLYNESPKHGAIVQSKATYIFGNGFAKIKDYKNPNDSETWNDLLRKCVLDYEKFYGYYLQIIWNKGGTIASIYHLKYHKVRTNYDNSTFWVKDEWDIYKQISAKDKLKERDYPAFDVNDRKGSQVLFVKSIGDQSDVYPLPSYYQALNYIDADRLMGRHVLGMAKDGFVASKLINFNEGEPSLEQKREIEKALEKKFTGSEGKKFMVAFNKNPANAVTVTDLGTSQLTKEDFTNINLLIQQEIFASHKITSPSLFGIKTEGQLGGRSELRDAYEIFKNTYVNERQQIHEEVFSGLFLLSGIPVEAKIIPTEPIGIELTSEIITGLGLPKKYFLDKLGVNIEDYPATVDDSVIINAINSLSPLVANKVLESMDPNEIRGLVKLPAKLGGTTGAAPLDANGNVVTEMVNDNLKNLTGRQFQNITRIVRQYGSGKITRQMAVASLRSGFGLSEQDITDFLGEELQFSEDVLHHFAEHGEDRSNFILLRQYDLDSEAILPSAFAEVNKLGLDVLGVISKNKNATPEEIAKTVGKDVDVINSVLSDLLTKELITESNGVRKLTKPLSEIADTKIQVLIRYSYEWKSEVPFGQRDTAAHPSREFCKKLMKLNRFYSRKDIQDISLRLGYSVFDRAGGWWTMPNGEHSVSCRHEWKPNVVLKKL